MEPGPVVVTVIKRFASPEEALAYLAQVTLGPDDVAGIAEAEAFDAAEEAADGTPNT